MQTLTTQHTAAPETKKKSESYSSSHNEAGLPCVYDFTNYREFLNAFFEAKKKLNSSYSASMFARRAGLGENSRGYLKLVIEGKRNLTSSTIRAFSEAVGLDPQASLYFENLVQLNQAEKAKDQQFYFSRLIASSQGRKTSQIEILESQMAYANHWHVAAVRELVALDQFQEDAAWIAKALKNRISKSEALDSIQYLLNLGLIKRNEKQKLVQSDPLIKIGGGFHNAQIQNFHIQMIERAKEALLEDAYSDRRASSLTLSCHNDDLPLLIRSIDDFRDQMNVRFGSRTDGMNSVIQLNFQVFYLTQKNLTTKEDK